MKMNNDLLRSLLIYIAGTEEEKETHRNLLAAYEHNDIAYHILLLGDELVDTTQLKVSATVIGRTINASLTLQSVTNEGRATLDAIRDDDAWNKAKKDMAESGLSELPFSIAVQVARDYMLKKQPV